MEYISVAIDGPAGAGKSTISKAVSKKLGYVYIDTGAMYRTVALHSIENGIDCKNEPERVIALLDGADIRIKNENGNMRIFLNGRDVSEDIRREEVSVGASNVAVIPEVRKKLVAMQRAMAGHDNIIMDGRDICTSVLPDATVKIYLTASVDERAKRRYNELIAKGVDCDFETICRDMEYRDKNDMEREVSPLRKAPDAVLADTTGLSFDEAAQMIERLIRER